ncbi:hypothetical protein, variant [Aphanomyces invadans]|uniref:C2 domain-containing protein n=1 Tax=Aphanomyces invadans TaxID=157072 RepID=A0A024TWK0_9STRA|nr:hypothetical protein, variant [Aphanomyces invadans]ETV98354.1 hypothetical protein, variant [Aphanomyces invadans]|eukprot:XP_008873229.1 hypothetical protein, variant [Aphanomyces invadans]
MPCTIKIRLVEARGLPVVERASKVTDAYVDITFASFEARSTVSKKSLTPRWDEEFRFDVADDNVLQSQPIMFKVMDHDVYTTDATIGIVYVDLNCILMKEGSSVQGWYPIYDTLLGVRGELHLVIRLHYFGDINPFRESSAGVQFFSLSTLDPAIFTTQRVLGFVEELVVHADPEYSWSDSFRTSRKSNEYRQMLLYKLSSQVSTMVGKKALDLGGNAVLGYRQFFDVEGDSGMVARACGTAVFLVPTDKSQDAAAPAAAVPSTSVASSSSMPTESDVETLMSGLLYNKRGLNNDDSAPPSASSVDVAVSTDQGSPRLATIPSLRKFNNTFKQRTNKNFELGAHDEVQLLTVKAFHPDTRVRLGGIVTARSVKFLGKMATKLADQETRDSWWLELREEVRAHAQSLQCSFVLGYIESCTIHDDVCVMSASGTAAVVKYAKKPRRPTGIVASDVALAVASVEGSDASPQLQSGAFRTAVRRPTKTGRTVFHESPCMMCHIPYSRNLAPFSNMRMVRCGVCGRKWVPEMLLSSTEPLCGMAITGSGTFIQARVCRQRRRGTGDANATIVSEALPFLEYEMHRQLMAKMRVLGVNALFGFESQVQISGAFVIGIITGTGIYLPALPMPQGLRITRNIDVKDDEDRRLVQLQAQIETMSNRNRSLMKHDAMCVIPPEFKTDRIKIESDDKAHKRALRKLKKKEDSSATSVERKPSTGDVDVPATLGDDEKVSSSDSSSDSEDEVSPDVNTDNKHPFVLEIDDETDEDLMSVLLEQPLPEGVSICNTDSLPGMTQHGANIHLFLSMKRVEWDEEHTRDTRVNVLFSHVFKMLFTSLLFKLRAFAPCVVCGLRTRVALAADNIIEVVLMGMAMLAGPELPPVDTALPFGSAGGGTSFADDDDAAADPDASPSLRLQILHNASAFSQVAPPMSPSVDAAATAAFVGPNAREWIELTPLSYVPGAKILRYLGRITLHFIKESWTVRECGGLGAFFHLFLSEAISVVRAHVRALGGNAMLSFRLVPIESSQLYRNQVYNMISVTGDAVLLEREQSPLPVGWHTSPVSRLHTPHVNSFGSHTDDPPDVPTRQTRSATSY